MVYAGKDFTPSDTGESEVYTFDFTGELQEGEAITSAVWSCALVRGTDANPALHLIGSPVNASPYSSHRVSGLVQGARYRLQAIVQTSLGNTVSMWAHLNCQAAN